MRHNEMVIAAHTSTAVEQAERPLLDSQPPGTLMRRASGVIAAHVTSYVREQYGRSYGAKVAVLVGPGNNGGDALYTAAALVARGMQVTAIMVADSAHPEALATFERAGGRCLWAAHEAVASVSGGGRHSEHARSQSALEPEVERVVEPAEQSAGDQKLAVEGQEQASVVLDVTAQDVQISDQNERQASGQPGAQSQRRPEAPVDGLTSTGADQTLGAFYADVATFEPDQVAGGTAESIDLAQQDATPVVIAEPEPDPTNGVGRRRAGRRSPRPDYRNPAGHTVTSRNVFAMPHVTSVLERADVVVDGMFGLRGNAGLHGVAAAVAKKVPSTTPVIAIDLPSGLAADSGDVPVGAVLPADRTLALGTAKQCHVIPPAMFVCGQVSVLDLGLDFSDVTPAVRVAEAADVAAAWPVPGLDEHKYTRGVLGVVAGGDRYPGAAQLTVEAATNTGVGMVRYIGSNQATSYVRAACPEAVSGSGQVQAWLLGPGVDDADTAARLAIRHAFSSGQPCVVDAGALDVLRGLNPKSFPQGPTVLTPHAGELGALLGVSREHVETNPVQCVTQYAGQVRATVLLKGRVTMVADAGGLQFTSNNGPSWLATAGSGDVLAGIIGALLASGVAPTQAAAMGAWVLGEAAQHASGGGPIRAGAVAAALPGVIAQLLK